MTYIPKITPPSASCERPFWSVMIPAYNPDPDHLREALISVLEQDPGAADMQIEVVDDGSSEIDVGALVKQVGGSRIHFHRSDHHTDIGRSWNRCVDRARGRWIHLLHQDDFILPGFYQRLRRGIATVPTLGMACCHTWIVDESGKKAIRSRLHKDVPGILSDWMQHIYVDLAIQTPAIVVRRDVYECIGGFDTSFHYALDWDMWKRLAATSAIWFDPEAMACYRLHGKSQSTKYHDTLASMVEIRRSIDTSRSYLPAAVRGRIFRQANRNYCHFAIELAFKMLFFRRDVRLAWAYVREAATFGSIVTVMVSVMRLGARAAMPMSVLQYWGRLHAD